MCGVCDPIMGLCIMLRGPYAEYASVSQMELAMQGLHVGDRFTESGNDSATRDCCSILWVANPEETDFLVSMLLKDIRASRAQPYIE